MSKENPRYTVLIVPGSSQKVRQISFHRNLIYGVGGVALALVLMTGYGSIRLAQSESLNLKNLSLKAENQRLKEANDAYQNSYAKLKGQIDYVSDMSKEMARQAKIDRSPEIDNIVGTGGPETVSALDHAADQLERELREINDRMKSDMLRMSSVPSGLPVNGYITDGFGMRHNPFSGEGHESHQGLDIAVDHGTPVAATADGLVIHAGPYSGYGNLVILYHSNGALWPSFKSDGRAGPARQARRPDRSRRQHGSLHRPARPLRSARKRSASQPHALRRPGAAVEHQGNRQNYNRDELTRLRLAF